MDSRVIGRYSQGHKGPLLVAFGAMHGNEPAGVDGIKTVLYLLEEEKRKKPEFKFYGTFIGIVGNLEAYRRGMRYIDKDLNRSWIYDDFKGVLESPLHMLNSEQKEMREIIGAMREEINKTNPDDIIVLDLHTTSAHGGIFSLITDDPLSEKMAKELHAPVIKGMLNGIKGSSIHFFHGKNMGIPTTAIAFESGQHQDPLSPFRAASAIINCMRTIGNVEAHDVENKHDEILINFSKDLPKVNTLIGKYSIKDVNHFAMEPGFKSFDKVHRGQLLAHDIDGPVYCTADAMILMPFYQKVGEDGFFLIKEG